MPPPEPAGPPGPSPAGWRTVTAAGVDLEVPSDLVPADATGVEGPTFVAESADLRLVLDASPFRDRLTSHGPGVRRWTETVDGHDQDVIAFDDGATSVVAAEVGGSVTATVRVRTGAGTGTALRIIRSITPHRGDTHDR